MMEHFCKTLTTSYNGKARLQHNVSTYFWLKINLLSTKVHLKFSQSMDSVNVLTSLLQANSDHVMIHLGGYNNAIRHPQLIAWESNFDYLDSLGLDEIVWIIQNMNINEEQNCLNKATSNCEQDFYKSFGKQYQMVLCAS